MPLNIRTNGSSGSNIIQAAWFNDIRDLFTGTMRDQVVWIRNVAVLQAFGANPASAATAALAASTAMGIGLYIYAYTYANTDGESALSPTVSITTTSGNQKVNLSSVTVGPTGTTKRNIYRTPVGGGLVFKFAGSIADNTTTTYADTLPDGSLGAVSPVASDLGGALHLKDNAGNVNAIMYNDGTLSSNKTVDTRTGTVGGTVTFSTPIWGSALKVGMVNFGTYQSASVQVFTFPSTIGRGFYIIGDMGSATPSFNWLLNGALISSTVISALATAGGTSSSQTIFHHNSIGTIVSSVNQLSIPTNAVNAQGTLLFAGI